MTTPRSSAQMADHDAKTVHAIVEKAKSASAVLASLTRKTRAELLHLMADELDSGLVNLAAIAAGETNLRKDILEAEVRRTSSQLRFFADVLNEGSYLELTVDTDRGHEELRRMLVPVGPVAVFGSSNFPFAYGVAGGDTASALAAGCAVIVKEHPSHPRTCRAVLAALHRALDSAGLPRETVSLVHGFDAGRHLVGDPGIHAVGFTGSVSGGRALFDLCAAWPAPIPFYGELGSLNCVVVSAGAAHRRGAQIGKLIADSLLLRGGQMCTKPGIILVPEGPEGDILVSAIADAVSAEPPLRLLNDNVRNQFVAGTHRMSTVPGVSVRAGALADQHLRSSPVAPVLLEAHARDLSRESDLEECFGPVTLVARYAETTEALDLLGSLEPALVASIHAEPEEDEAVLPLVRKLSEIAGRLVWGAATTGLIVGWATHHGGAYPASTSAAHSSVGASSIRRWLRPVCWQGFPGTFLPEELQVPDAAPHRLNGILMAAATPSDRGNQ